MQKMQIRVVMCLRYIGALAAEACTRFMQNGRAALCGKTKYGWFPASFEPQPESAAAIAPVTLALGRIVGWLAHLLAQGVHKQNIRPVSNLWA